MRYLIRGKFTAGALKSIQQQGAVDSRPMVVGVNGYRIRCERMESLKWIGTRSMRLLMDEQR